MVGKDGQKFEGCWLEGRKDGPGFMVGQDGDWFEGIWRSGKKEGPGLNPVLALKMSVCCIYNRSSYVLAASDC